MRDVLDHESMKHRRPPELLDCMKRLLLSIEIE